MKKLFSTVLVVSIVSSLFVSSVYAAKGGNSGGNSVGNSGKSSSSHVESGNSNETVAAPDKAVAGTADTVAVPSETVTEPGDTVAVPGETAIEPGNTVAVPDETAAEPSEATIGETTDNKNSEAKLEKEASKVARKELIRQIVAEKKANNDNSIPVLVNGKEVKSDVPPVVKYGRTLIPVRAVTNALGALVQWDGDTKTVTITKDDTTIIIILGSSIATVNGAEVVLDAPAELINNSTMVPIRFIAQALKQKVEWDQDTGAVIIEDDDSTTATGTDGDTVNTDTASGADAATAPDPATDVANTDSSAGIGTTQDQAESATGSTGAAAAESTTDSSAADASAETQTPTVNP